MSKKNDSSWAGVMIDKNKKVAVRVKDIHKFNLEKYDKMKYYYFNYGDSVEKGLIVRTAATKDAVESNLFSKRTKIPPKELIRSASDLSDANTLTRKVTKESNNNVLSRSLESQIQQLVDSSRKRKHEKSEKTTSFKKVKNDDKNKSPTSTSIILGLSNGGTTVN